MLTRSRSIPSGNFAAFGLKRLHSSHVASQTLKPLSKILAFPVTKNKTFLYFKYTDTLINNTSPLVKYEAKAVNLASKGWKKLEDSEKSYNKKIVGYITKFLQRIPWTEDSLRSIPSSTSLLRQLRNHESSEHKLINPLEIDTLTDHDVIEIPIFYPSSIVSNEVLQNEIQNISSNGIAYHRKQMLLTGLAVPLSLPLALVPVIPNIPGFYFAYRTYCNLKAYLGGQHLQELIEQDHLLYKESTKLDDVYKSASDGFLYLNETLIDKIVEAYDIEQIRTALTKALKQEREIERRTIDRI